MTKLTKKQREEIKEGELIHALEQEPWHPIDIAHYALGDGALTVTGAPNLLDAAKALKFLQGVQERNQFWIGDLWRDTEKRFPERCDQLLGLTTYSRESLRNFGWVATSIQPERRMINDGVEFEKHKVVASLAEKEQDRILQKAKDENLSLSEVKLEARLVKRRKVSTGQAELVGIYRVILADPDYDTQTLDKIAQWAVAAHMRKHAVLFLRHEERHRFDIKAVIDAWGFVFKTALVYDRVDHQDPHGYLSERHEHLLLCVRGKLPPDRLTPMVDSVQVARTDPLRQMQRVVAQLYDGPYLLMQGPDEMQKWDGKEVSRPVEQPT